MKEKIIIKNKRADNFNIKHRLANKAGLHQVLKVLDKNFNVIIDCRIYFSSSFRTCYCCCWIFHDDTYIACSGKAGGIGYDRISAAVQIALDNGGVIVKPRIWGVGISAVKRALIDIAKKVSGKRRVHLIDSFA